MECLEMLKRDITSVDCSSDIQKWLTDHASSELPPNSIIERHRMGFAISLDYEVQTKNSAGGSRRLSSDDAILLGSSVLDSVLPNWQEDVSAALIPLTKATSSADSGVLSPSSLVQPSSHLGIQTKKINSKLSAVLSPVRRSSVLNPPSKSANAAHAHHVEFKYDLQEDNSELSFSER
eukprot:TRINITY_DN7701_c0_g1_i1.p1 TRINITY_DN7701_c0_g1~~TRINITY_DN7701_c0_g1_i1.p1  ORF type:complete len:178 (-),score=31.56 TRINITY_DN7701_c0_g1_i1:46-579(-)